MTRRRSPRILVALALGLISPVAAVRPLPTYLLSLEPLSSDDLDSGSARGFAGGSVVANRTVSARGMGDMEHQSTEPLTPEPTRAMEQQI